VKLALDDRDRDRDAVERELDTVSVFADLDVDAATSELLRDWGPAPRGRPLGLLGLFVIVWRFAPPPSRSVLSGS
jgi:hypothetical protein